MTGEIDICQNKSIENLNNSQLGSNSDLDKINKHPNNNVLLSFLFNFKIKFVAINEINLFICENIS